MKEVCSNIDYLLVVLFANIFSHLGGCLFSLFMVSFAVPKLLSIIWSHLFCFYFHYSRRWVKKISLQFMSKSVLPMISSKSFIVSALTFRSLIHFQFAFVYGVRYCSNFILLQVAVQFFPASFIEETIFSPLYILTSFVID